jgi:putative membrane protein
MLMLNKLSSAQKRMGILLILYVVGFLGILSPFGSYFIALSPVNLVVSALIIFPRQNTKKHLIIFATVVALGFLIEWIGVQTGVIFGVYHYGPTLSPLILGIPLIIGLNWWLLALGSIETAFYITKNKFIQPFLAAVLMTSIDFIMEQVAPQLDFWYWQNEHIPIQNFTAWFLVSIIFTSLIRMVSDVNKRNPSAIFLVALQGLFFFGLFLLL